MNPLILAVAVFFADSIAAFIVFTVLTRRGNPLALPIAGFIVLAGIVSAAMVYLFMGQSLPAPTP